ncbi:nicotinate N-methyltransferase 1 [Lathyrus oleraceus]|uniref:Caffeic acid 3-O-methyltransferase n=1 Tax=Pisum sativum TaxID=3888 RepID=A0A9D5AW69_PEA|nr:nicotinate N-methyltransferase 1-like [Pisum sativum]KAI5426547.1 hypothetical protein KIW84_032110 [Pisum sativum]
MEGKKVFQSQNKSRLAILSLSNMMSVPSSVVAVIQLKVPDAIFQGGSNVALSAAEILAVALPNGGGEPDNLERILRLLTSYDIFEEHLCSNGVRKFSLTEIGKCLATDEEGLSYSPYVLQHNQDAYMRAWPCLKDAVENPSVEPFRKVNGGEHAMKYYTNPNQIALFNKAFIGMTSPFMREVLEFYDGFKEVQTLVDVGGSTGVSLSLIMDKFPNITKGINFDLPQILASAPQLPGITHVAGDATEFVPSGDAVMMKWLCSGFSDDECRKMMKNCHKALPADGKLIICDPVLPELTDESTRTKAILGGDVFMMTMYGTKKTRTEKQFKELGIAAGFSRFSVFYIDSYLVFMEFHK